MTKDEQLQAVHTLMVGVGRLVGFLDLRWTTAERLLFESELRDMTARLDAIGTELTIESFQRYTDTHPRSPGLFVEDLRAQAPDAEPVRPHTGWPYARSLTREQLWAYHDKYTTWATVASVLDISPHGLLNLVSQKHATRLDRKLADAHALYNDTEGQGV